MLNRTFLLVALATISWTPSMFNSDDPVHMTAALESKMVSTAPADSRQLFEEKTQLLYSNLKCEDAKPQYPAFRYALAGYYKMKSKGLLKSDDQLLSIIDFSVSSRFPRLWVIDMRTLDVPYFSLVAHGQNTGSDFAKHFSNIPESHQSSLGFYRTAETYHGKHGLSLRLDGMESGINDLARPRAIVMHAADYVSQEFINNNGRLGRSFGCPAIPLELRDELIPLIADGNCLFIYYPDKQYLEESALLEDAPMQFELPQS